MELIDNYLDKQTVIADFWIFDNENEVNSVENQGITIEKSKVYYKKYHINIIMKSEHTDSLQTYAAQWEKKFPKVVITKASGRVEAYDLRLVKLVDKENGHTVLEFIGVAAEE